MRKETIQTVGIVIMQFTVNTIRNKDRKRQGAKQMVCWLVGAVGLVVVVYYVIIIILLF
jgi:predicted nucleic acid-binding Zn ribbon protein